MDDVMRTIESRHSIRRYTSEPVSDETLNKLLSAAACAPSGKKHTPVGVCNHSGTGKDFAVGGFDAFQPFSGDGAMRHCRI